MSHLRSELFKLFYLDSLFDLNHKADASEAMLYLLKLIHGAFIRDSRDKCKSVHEELDLKCVEEYCFVHKMV